MVRFAHLADVHLGSAFAWAREENKARRLRQKQLDGLSRTLELAREHQCQAVLIAGDLFDSAFADRETFARFVHITGHHGDLPILIAAGNHDPACEGSVYTRGGLPENVRVFPVEGDCIEIGHELRVHGLSAGSARDQRAPLSCLRAKRDGRTEVALIHAELTASLESAQYAPVTRAQLRASGFSYVALGHIHERSIPQREGSTFYAYAGALQGRGFDECGDKGFYLVEAQGEQIQAQFIPLGGSRFVVVPVDLSGVHDYESALARYEQALAPYGPEDQVRVLLRGRVSAGDSEWPALLTRLADGDTRYIRDETVIAREQGVAEDAQGLRSLVIADLQEKMDGAAHEREREVYSRALRYALMAMDGEKVVPYED